jgi:hypothetical protein
VEHVVFEFAFREDTYNPPITLYIISFMKCNLRQCLQYLFDYSKKLGRWIIVIQRPLCYSITMSLPIKRKAIS